MKLKRMANSAPGLLPEMGEFGYEAKSRKARMQARGRLVKVKGGRQSLGEGILSHGKTYVYKQWMGLSSKTAQTLEAKNESQDALTLGSGQWVQESECSDHSLALH